MDIIEAFVNEDLSSKARYWNVQHSNIQIMHIMDRIQKPCSPHWMQYSYLYVSTPVYFSVIPSTPLHYGSKRIAIRLDAFHYAPKNERRLIIADMSATEKCSKDVLERLEYVSRNSPGCIFVYGYYLEMLLNKNSVWHGLDYYVIKNGLNGTLEHLDEFLISYELLHNFMKFVSLGEQFIRYKFGKPVKFTWAQYMKYLQRFVVFNEISYYDILCNLDSFHRLKHLYSGRYEGKEFLEFLELISMQLEKKNDVMSTV